MRKFFSRFAMLIGTLTILSGIVVVIVSVVTKKSVPATTILEIDFEQDLPENIPANPLAELVMENKLTLRDAVDAIDKGSTDDRVVGIVARIGSNSKPMAQIQELRDAIERFRAKKKFAIAYSESFGEGGPGTAAYYLATAFDSIYLQPSGDIALTGMIVESYFLKGVFEKLGVNFHGAQRHEYKSAFDMYTKDKFTDPSKEAITSIMSSVFDQVKQGISKSRKIPQDQLQSLVDAAPYLGKEAIEAKLVDGLAYRDEVYTKANALAGDKAELLYLDKYLQLAGRPNESGTQIALIYGVGAVSSGDSKFNPIQGGQTMGSDTVAAAIRAAVEDKNVRAILFRVDSPGGSYVASDTIWREVVRARLAKKPVIVSMGGVAGSGGYFVAMAADKIVAQPGTITGSIGVFGGKLLTKGFWDKIGLAWDEVHIGKNATMFTGTHDYSPSEWARFEASLDRIYDDFTTKAAEGRKLPKEKVLEIAKGRIWSGQDAKRIGLVDELGGLETALKLAKQEAKLGIDEAVNIVVFPRPKSLWDKLLRANDADNSGQEGIGELIGTFINTVQPVVSHLTEIGVLGSEIRQKDVLRMTTQGANSIGLK